MDSTDPLREGSWHTPSLLLRGRDAHAALLTATLYTAACILVLVTTIGAVVCLAVLIVDVGGVYGGSSLSPPCNCDEIYRRTSSFTNVDAFEIVTSVRDANLFFDEGMPRTWSLTRLTHRCRSTREVYDSGGLSVPPKAWYRLEVFDSSGQLVDLVQPIGLGTVHILVHDDMSRDGDDDDSTTTTRLDDVAASFGSLWDHAARTWTCTSLSHVPRHSGVPFHDVLPCPDPAPTGIILYEPRLSYFAHTTSPTKTVKGVHALYDLADAWNATCIISRPSQSQLSWERGQPMSYLYHNARLGARIMSLGECCA